MTIVGDYRLLVLVSTRDLDTISYGDHNTLCIYWQGSSSNVKR